MVCIINSPQSGSSCDKRRILALNSCECAHMHLLCSCNQHELQVTAAEKRAARKASLEKIRSDAMETCLTAPFVEAAVANAMPTCISLALAWQSYTELLYSQVIRLASPQLCWCTMTCCNDCTQLMPGQAPA